jgi:hypothetical protein
VCEFNTAPIFCQPWILRNLICPLATRLKSGTSVLFGVLYADGSQRLAARSWGENVD